MATAYCNAFFESIPGNETNVPTSSAKVIYFPATQFTPGLNPSPLDRNDEIRNLDEPLMLVPEHYAPEWSLETRNYPDSLAFLMKMILGAPVTTAGNGVITDPDSATIPATAYRHVWTAPFGPAGASPMTAQLRAAYKDQTTFFKMKGAACQTLSLTTPETGGGRLAASGPALYMAREADPSLTPTYESLLIPPFLRRNLTVPTWLSGGATSIEDFSVTITNPVEPYSSLGIASAYPDVMEKGEAPITFTGSIPKRQLDPDDYDALVASTGFAAKAKWISTKVIAATAYFYSAWIEFDNAQYTTGGPVPLENKRRHGGTFDFAATSDGAGASATVTIVNATASYN
ncbi:MAG: hypothetical protein H0W82_00030 [Actinobacteria bacterium]|nr:hypothetical protein [Actinomycetota bacterium]